MSIREKLSDMLDMPKDVVQDLAKITMIGERDLTVENYKGILEYSDTIIRLKTNGRGIKITGENLGIRTITDEDIEVYGRINTLEFVG